MHRAPARAARRGRRAIASSGRMPRPVSAASAPGLRAGHAGGGFGGPPTKRRPSSSYCSGSGRRRRLEHRVAPRLRLRERHHLADVRLVGEQRRPAVDAERDAAVRRRAVLERVEDGAELLAHALERLALEQEAALEQVAPMDPDRPAAELPAVERRGRTAARAPDRPGPRATVAPGRPTRSRAAPRPRARRR